MISILCLFAAGICYGWLSYWNFYQGDHYSDGFWSKGSWGRKYNFGPDLPVPDNWYYQLFNIQYREAFPLSTTVLVFLTDGFHLVQFIMTNLFVAAVVMHQPWTGFWAWLPLAYLGAFHIAFNLSFEFFKRKV